MAAELVSDLIGAAIGVVVLTAVAIYDLSVDGRRRRKLRTLARSMGMNFNPSKNHGFDDRYSNFKCLRQGNSYRYACNVMEGRWEDRPILLFDYHYKEGDRKYEFSAVIITSSVPLKPLCIRRESLFDKLVEFAGFDDINFESAQFSRKFYVKSPDKRWAYDVIHPRMMEYLLNAPDFGIQFGYKHVIAWQRLRFKPATFKAAADMVSGILDRLPEYVVRQQKGETLS